MKLPRRKFLYLAASAVALPAGSPIARAQAYPTRPITMVVPYASGGPSDTIARILAERMRESLGQTVIIENVTGAAGTIGVGRVARAAPDGYTICIGHWGTHVVNGAIYDIPYHVRPHFSPAAAVEYLAYTVKSFRCSEVLGDHYAGEFPRELFQKHGIRYEVCKTPKSDLFRDLLPMLNSGSITLPRNDRLIAQIVGLERRVTRAGKDSITHPDHGHDDVANCVAGVATSLRFPTDNIDALAGDNIPGVGSWYYLQLMQHIARHS